MSFHELLEERWINAVCYICHCSACILSWNFSQSKMVSLIASFEGFWVLAFQFWEECKRKSFMFSQYFYYAGKQYSLTQRQLTKHIFRSTAWNYLRLYVIDKKYMTMFSGCINSTCASTIYIILALAGLAKSKCVPDQSSGIWIYTVIRVRKALFYRSKAQQHCFVKPLNRHLTLRKVALRQTGMCIHAKEGLHEQALRSAFSILGRQHETGGIYSPFL